jgi:hypothetical protein
VAAQEVAPLVSPPAGAQEVAPLVSPPAGEAARAVPQPLPPPAAPAPAPPPARVPIARRWWFWTGLGAAAVGAVIAGIMLSPPRPYTGNAEPGLIPPF